MSESVSENYDPLSPEEIAKIEDKLYDLRVNGNGLTRLLYFDKKTRDFGRLPGKGDGLQYGTYCMGPHIYDHEIGNPRFVYAIPLSGETPKNKQEATSAFKGGPVSRRWAEFLLSETGPFRRVAAHSLTRDIDDINERTGFIFEDTSKLGAGELYGFSIGVRFAQEFYSRAKRWTQFVDEGVDPAVAYMMSVYWAWTTSKGDESDEEPPMVVSRTALAGHTILYTQPVFVAKPWVTGTYPKDTLACGKGFCYFENIAMGIHSHPLWKLAYNAYRQEVKDQLFCGVKAGMSISEVNDCIMAEVNREAN